MKAPEALIFDLGGVILNIDYERTADAFRALGCSNFDELYSQAAQSQLFDRFETGRISPMAFINKLLDLIPVSVSANQVVHAWNAMILDFPVERLELIRELSRKKPVFLLSNTNEIHYEKVLRRFRETGFESTWNSLFTHIYLSHELGMRKPDEEIFLHVCRENDLVPENTLFIDDTIRHIESARAVGLQTLHLEKGKDIRDYFS